MGEYISEVYGDRARLTAECVPSRFTLVRSITELNNVKSRRDIQCQREDNALWTGAAWVRNENREGRFKGTVHEPIRLLLTVKDRRHARVAEAAINYQTFKTVICTEEEDYTTVTNRFTRYPKAGSEKPVDLRINVARLPPEKRVLANYRRPMSNEQVGRAALTCDRPCQLF